MEPASAQIDFSLILLETVFHVPVDAIFVLQILFVHNVFLLSFCKVMFAKTPAIMDSQLLEINVLDAQLDAFNVLKILFAIIVLITYSCIKVVASISVQQELLEINLQEIGNVFHATLHAKHV
jgi:hypothetical protein